MREHGQNTDNLRTVGEQVALRSIHRSLKNLEKNGGPPETRTPDPLIKSASPNEPQPRSYQKLQALQGFASNMLGNCWEVYARALGQKADKYTLRRVADREPQERACLLIANQTVHPKSIQQKPFLRPVRELSVSFVHGFQRKPTP